MGQCMSGVTAKEHSFLYFCLFVFLFFFLECYAVTSWRPGPQQGSDSVSISKLPCCSPGRQLVIAEHARKTKKQKTDNNNKKQKNQQAVSGDRAAVTVVSPDETPVSS